MSRPIYGTCEETKDHLLFKWDLAQIDWNNCYSWFSVHMALLADHDTHFLSHCRGINLTTRRKALVDSVACTNLNHLVTK